MRFLLAKYKPTKYFPRNTTHGIPHVAFKNAIHVKESKTSQLLIIYICQTGCEKSNILPIKMQKLKKVPHFDQQCFYISIKVNYEFISKLRLCYTIGDISVRISTLILVVIFPNFKFVRRLFMGCHSGIPERFTLDFDV